MGNQEMITFLSPKIFFKVRIKMCIRDRFVVVPGAEQHVLPEVGADEPVSYTHLDVYKRQP